MFRKQGIWSIHPWNVSSYCTGIRLKRARQPKTSTRVTGKQADIRTRYLQNTGVECDHYTNVLGAWVSTSLRRMKINSWCNVTRARGTHTIIWRQSDQSDKSAISSLRLLCYSTSIADVHCGLQNVDGEVLQIAYPEIYW
jgi:hypothetical protein